jgi:hypothetical protein
MFQERWSHAGEKRGEKKDEAIIYADQTADQIFPCRIIVGHFIV